MNRRDHFVNFITAVAIALTVAGFLGDIDAAARVAVTGSGLALFLVANTLLDDH